MQIGLPFRIVMSSTCQANVVDIEQVKLHQPSTIEFTCESGRIAPCVAVPLGAPHICQVSHLGRKHARAQFFCLTGSDFQPNVVPTFGGHFPTPEMGVRMSSHAARGPQSGNQKRPPLLGTRFRIRFASRMHVILFAYASRQMHIGLPFRIVMSSTCQANVVDIEQVELHQPWAIDFACGSGRIAPCVVVPLGVPQTCKCRIWVESMLGKHVFRVPLH